MLLIFLLFLLPPIILVLRLIFFLFLDVEPEEGFYKKIGTKLNKTRVEL